MKHLSMIADWLVILGGISLGMMGAFGMDVFSWIPGPEMVRTVLYVLIGVSALYMAYRHLMHKA